MSQLKGRDDWIGEKLEVQLCAVYKKSPKYKFTNRLKKGGTDLSGGQALQSHTDRKRPSSPCKSSITLTHAGETKLPIGVLQDSNAKTQQNFRKLN